MTVFTITGSLSDEDVYFCQHIANRIKSNNESIEVEFSVFPEIVYLTEVAKLKQSKGGPYLNHTALHLVQRDGNYIGNIKSLIQLAVNEYNIRDASIASRAAFNRSMREETNKLLLKNRDYVYLEFGEASNDKSSFGKVLIEMFTDLCPRACEHFITLCRGSDLKHSSGAKLTYERCPIHRLVNNSWLQCGDILDGSGSNSIVAQSPKNSDKSFDFIPDECFSADFGFEFGGMVGLSNTGPHTNGSQFFITLGPCEWMNNQFVGIGRLVYGYKTLRLINEMKTNSMQRPESEIIIKSCGIEYGKETN